MDEKVGIVGAGTMGHGIAELCAISGYDVVLADVGHEILEKAMEKIRWSIGKLESSRALVENPGIILSRIRTTTELRELAGSKYIIEAVKEKIEVKRQVLRKLDSLMGPECIFFSNTSTIPITELASMTGREEIFAGLHFSNPPVKNPLVEVIRGKKTSARTVGEARSFAISLGKEVIVVDKDLPGFLVNRLNDRLFTEALLMLGEGVTFREIDALLRFRMNFSMGVFELMDFVGIDTVLNAKTEMIGHGFNTSPSEKLSGLVEKGMLGMKTGKGFYKYQKPSVYSRPLIQPSGRMFRVNPVRLFATVINETAWMIRNKAASPDDIEKAMLLAMNWPAGPLSIADRLGIDNIEGELNRLHSSTGESRYIPDSLLLEKQRHGDNGLLSGKGFREWPFASEDIGPVKFQRIDSFALITLNRPEKLNSLSEELWSGIRIALEKALQDPDIRSAIITGAGRAFSAGDDIQMMRSWKGSADAKRWLDKYASPLIDLLASFPKPLISAVNGVAFGGGAEINLLFDVVVAADSAVFSFSESLIGAMPPIASSFGIAVTGRRLLPYLLTGDWMAPEKAKELGLVDVVTDDEMTLMVAMEYANRLSRAAPLSIQSIKSVANLHRTGVQPEARFSQNELIILSSSEDFAEGQEAFLSKRKPVWAGR